MTSAISQTKTDPSCEIASRMANETETVGHLARRKMTRSKMTRKRVGKVTEEGAGRSRLLETSKKGHGVAVRTS